MSDSVKKRLYRLKCRVKKILEHEGFDVLDTPEDQYFHLVALRSNESRLIHISLDAPGEKLLVRLKRTHPGIKKEVWYREKNLIQRSII